MRSHAHVQITGRGGAPGAYEGFVDGVPALITCSERGGVLDDPRSAFFGGQGLIPPFRPAVHHAAAVWSRVEPTRVLAHGVGSEGPYVALRRLSALTLAALREQIPFGPGFVEAVFGHVASELAALHSVGVVHRDLRADTVLISEGRARLAGLGAARLDGCGPPCAAGVGFAATDLRALGALAVWMLGGRPVARLGVPLAGVVAALTSPDPAARPTSVNEVLRALGEPEGPPPAFVAPHPALLAWNGGSWADRLIAQGNVWEVVRGADEGDLDRWALAAVAGRLLLRPRSTDGWLALGTLCWRIAERAPGGEREAHRAQALEAKARARAAWHPAARALGELLTGGESVRALCETGQLTRATRRAQAGGRGGALALVGLHADDPDQVEEGLLDAAADDPDALRVAASRLLEAAPRDAPSAAVRLALPRVQLEAVRRLCAMAAEGDAIRVASACPEPVCTRARLTVALHVGERAEALAIARLLATSGAWDTTVAATLVLYAPDGEPLQIQARRLLRSVAPRTDLTSLDKTGANFDPTDLVAWSGLLCARVAGDDVEPALADLERAPPSVGSGPWRLLVLELVATGAVDAARILLLTALRRHPADPALATMQAALELLDGDLAAAAVSASHARAQDPRSPFGWLAEAACALWSGDDTTARDALAAAARRGVREPAHRALEACLPGGE